MNGSHCARFCRTGLLAAWLCGGLAVGVAAPPDNADSPKEGPNLRSDDRLPRPRRTESAPSPRKIKEGEVEARLPQAPPSILPPEAHGIDLTCVLKLAGVDNPDINIARQRVIGAEALRMAAFAMVLPNFNAGANYDAHTGPLQQSSGNILKVNRNALYFGMGAGATAAGTVPVPGIQYVINPSVGVFGALSVMQTVRVAQFENLAVRNQIFLRTATGYMNLLRAEGRLAIATKNRSEAHEIARLTAVYAITGQGKESDADRAATELAHRNSDVVEAEGEILVASAQLARLINVPPTVPMRALEGWEGLVPRSMVPDPIPLQQLLLIALDQRPELAARRASIRRAILQLYNAKLLMFSPTILAGYSAGSYGGGSNLIGQPGGFQGFAEARFGSFAPRDDIDVVMYWTAQNMGVGNWARIKGRAAERRIAELEFVRDLNMVRADVATSYARTHARFAQIAIAQRGVESGMRSYKEDLDRIEGGIGLPIELLNSFDLLAAARYQYLESLVAYDNAQFALYVALGQPPANNLAREIPTDL
ncbi:MAG TPA: TolC family protein, partial [Gemmataceae bacterium]|nr:TolC family protein [Gemmataceae bacterium]